MKRFSYLARLVAASVLIVACGTPESEDVASQKQAVVTESPSASIREVSSAGAEPTVDRSLSDSTTEKINMGGSETDATATFPASCTGWSVTFRKSDGAILNAHAASCRRINGTWTGALNWSGVCTSTLNNCNGSLRCGGC